MMNVPKFLWSEVVMAATSIITRMPLRVPVMKTPYKMIDGKNEFIVSSRVFGCTFFVRDRVGKLDTQNWTHMLTSASSLDTHLDKKATSVVRGEHL
jgi:hypothetical protein